MADPPVEYLISNINVGNYYTIASGPEPFMHNKTWGVHTLVMLLAEALS